MLKTAAIVAVLSTSAQAEDDRRLPDKMGFQYPKWLSGMNDGSLERPRQMQVDRADLSKEQQQALDDIVSIHIQTACRSTAKMLYRRYDHTDKLDIDCTSAAARQRARAAPTMRALLIVC